MIEMFSKSSWNILFSVKFQIGNRLAKHVCLGKTHSFLSWSGDGLLDPLDIMDSDGARLGSLFKV